jgi:hypothetical protein
MKDSPIRLALPLSCTGANFIGNCCVRRVLSVFRDGKLIALGHGAVVAFVETRLSALAASIANVLLLALLLSYTFEQELDSGRWR